MEFSWFHWLLSERLIKFETVAFHCFGFREYFPMFQKNIPRAKKLSHRICCFFLFVSIFLRTFRFLKNCLGFHWFQSLKFGWLITGWPANFTVDQYISLINQWVSLVKWGEIHWFLCGRFITHETVGFHCKSVKLELRKSVNLEISGIYLNPLISKWLLLISWSSIIIGQ